MACQPWLLWLLSHGEAGTAANLGRGGGFLLNSRADAVRDAQRKPVCVRALGVGSRYKARILSRSGGIDATCSSFFGAHITDPKERTGPLTSFASALLCLKLRAAYFNNHAGARGLHGLLAMSDVSDVDDDPEVCSCRRPCRPPGDFSQMMWNMLGHTARTF